MHNVILIGMPGSGKSTVGVLLAKALGYGFLDTDLVIQQREGLLLQDILDQFGVKHFLQVEEEAVRLLARAGSDRDYGARPLRRAIAAQVEDPAADLLLEGALCSGGTLRVVAEGDRVQVRPAQRQMENDAHSEI